MSYTELKTCCACGSADLKDILNLGPQPLANSYLASADDPEESYPLQVRVCGDCQHVQLGHAVDPDLLFRHYLYVSGTTQTLHDNMDWFARFVDEYLSTQDWFDRRVLDIGCNDGTQLDYFRALGWDTHGIDPATNIVPEALSKGHDVMCDYFNADTAAKLSGREYQAIVAQNVVAHNFDAVTFLRNMRQLMGEETRAFVQISQVDMIRNNEFDTCYHEHINFFNVLSLTKIAERAGLHIEDIIKQPIHGNSYIVVLHRSRGNPVRIANLVALDRAQGLYNMDTYERWADNARQLMQQMVKVIEQARAQGRVIVGYGAAAKGMTVLNFAQPYMDFIIDDNPLKQNRYTPGTHIPIVDISWLDKHQSQQILFVPLAWNFYDEIVRRIQQLRHRSDDQFLRYFPKVEVRSES